ncbi:hypothetical protein NDU88_001562 [Pleurodeles waltl]|uniref:Uncharacterized protein n=1 Tax=Pleurodeles waltl TaxID=8319 RepID=A0AAV7W0L6_PLEWA|nr:hypothetical protein NDU88_001562 [Pleurodeles waltl]
MPPTLPLCGKQDKLAQDYGLHLASQVAPSTGTTIGAPLCALEVANSSTGREAGYVSPRLRAQSCLAAGPRLAPPTGTTISVPFGALTAADSPAAWEAGHVSPELLAPFHLAADPTHRDYRHHTIWLT